MKILLGKKVGMTQIYGEDGAVMPVTILDVSNNVISKVVKDGEKISHIEIGKDKRKVVTKADVGNYKELTYVPRFKRVFKVKESLDVKVGDELKADVFSVGDKIQIRGVNKGKGFQGVVKRWGFAGGPRTHGASDRERAPGSLGTRTIPGRVFKGKKMGGHMGARTKTVLGLRVAELMLDENLIAVKGSIPGAKNSYVIIKSEGK